VSDCWNPRYDNAPADGAPNMSGDCTRRGLRGGGWGSPAEHVRAAFRLADPFGNRYDNMGFRIARDLR
jgi:formylglycine-generating enzyme required for sulfatase activity